MRRISQVSRNKWFLFYQILFHSFQCDEFNIFLTADEAKLKGRRISGRPPRKKKKVSVSEEEEEEEEETTEKILSETEN